MQVADFTINIMFHYFSVLYISVTLSAATPAYFRGFTLIALKEGKEGDKEDDHAGTFQVRELSLTCTSRSLLCCMLGSKGGFICTAQWRLCLSKHKYLWMLTWERHSIFYIPRNVFKRSRLLYHDFSLPSHILTVKHEHQLFELEPRTPEFVNIKIFIHIFHFVFFCLDIFIHSDVDYDWEVFATPVMTVLSVIK